MATFHDLKVFIDKLSPHQLETEVCAFDEDGDQVLWLTGEGMKVNTHGLPELHGGTDFGQDYVKVGSKKFALPPKLEDPE